MTTTSDLARLLMMQGTRLPDAGLGPVTNTTRAGRPNPMLTATQDAPRPNDYMAPVAETLSIPMGAYGAGQLVGGGINAMLDADYASGAGQIALGMAGMLPMPKIKAFHASQAEFDRFKPSSYRGATYLASTPEDARRAAGAGAREYVMDTASEVPNRPWHTYEAEIDPSKVEGLALSPRQNEFFNQLPESISLNDYNTKWRQQIEKEFGTVPAWLYDESTIKMPDGRTFTSEQLSKLSDAEFQDVVSKGSETLRRGDVPQLSYEDAAKTGRDIFGKQFSHYSPTGDEAAAARRVLDSGMGAYLLQDEGGLSIAVADPSIANIVSRNGQPLAPQGIRAFHGSPHDFDKFDMSKIGTGEGAQAYGHGLYFAEREGVARSYRDKLSKIKANELEKYNIMLDGNPWKPRDDIDQLIASEINRFARLGLPIETLQNTLTNAWAKGKGDQYIYAAQRVSDIIKSGGRFSYDPGHMYEVNIKADPADFLDWDKPLSEQSEKVQRALMNHPQAHKMDSDQLGALLYEDSKLVPGEFADKKAATQELQKLGIPGIRYLDQMSRDKGKYNLQLTYKGKPYGEPIPVQTKNQLDDAIKEYEAKGFGTEVQPIGTSNYVVFDDALVEILRKYGLLGPVAGGGTLAGMLMGGDEGATY